MLKFDSKLGKTPVGAVLIGDSVSLHWDTSSFSATDPMTPLRPLHCFPSIPQHLLNL
jgi:hypothetical protein